MIVGQRASSWEHRPRLLVLDSSTKGYGLCGWLQDQNTMPILVHDADEALAALGAVFFRDDAFDALILVADADTPAFEFERVTSAFHDIPVALLSESPSSSLVRWAKIHRIPVLQRPLQAASVKNWLAQVSKSSLG